MKPRWALVVLAALILTALFSLSAIAQTPDPAIAFFALTSVRGQDTQQLMVMNADGSNQTALITVPTRLTSRPSWRPAKRPKYDSTGTNIIGYEYQMIILYLTDWTLRMVTFNVINNAVQEVTIEPFVPPALANQGYQFYGAGWSPDGQWISISSSAGVYVIHPDYTGLTRVVAGHTWNPDSNSTAYFQYYGANMMQSIVTTPVIDSNGDPIPAEEVSGTFTVISGLNDVQSLAWSPSGDWIAYWDKQDQKNTPRIYVVPAMGGIPQAVPSTSKAGYMTWPDNDDALIYGNNGQIVKQGMVNGVGTGQVTVLAAPTKNTAFSSPVWRRGATASP